jgi:proteasome component ECM29
MKCYVNIYNEEMIRNPSNTRIRIKLYPYLLKSRTASTIFPHAIQVGRWSLLTCEDITFVRFRFCMRVSLEILQMLGLNISRCNSLKISFRSTSRLGYALQSSLFRLSSAELTNLVGVSKLLLHALEKVLNTETHKTHDASRLRSLTYVLIGKLSYRVPKLFADDIRLTQQFFEALKTEDNECCLNIQEALK